MVEYRSILIVQIDVLKRCYPDGLTHCLQAEGRGFKPGHVFLFIGIYVRKIICNLPTAL